MPDESMEPMIRDKSIVLGDEIEQGDWGVTPPGVYAIVYRQQLCIGRIRYNTLHAEGKLVLWADNEKYGSHQVLAEDIKGMFRIMKVVDQKVS